MLIHINTSTLSYAPIENPRCLKNWTQSNLYNKYGSEFKYLVQTIVGRIQYNRAEAGIGGDCDEDPNCFEDRYVSCVLNAYWDGAVNGDYKAYAPSTQSIVEAVRGGTFEDAWKVKEILDQLYYVTKSKNVYHLDDRYLDPYNYFRSGGSTSSGTSVTTPKTTTTTTTTTKTGTNTTTKTGTTSKGTSQPSDNNAPVYDYSQTQQPVTKDNTMLYVGGAAVGLLVLYFLTK